MFKKVALLAITIMTVAQVHAGASKQILSSSLYKVLKSKAHQQSAHFQTFAKAYMNRSEALAALRLKGNPSSTQIHTAFREAAHHHHPDKGGKKEDFHKALQARDYLLSNPISQQAGDYAQASTTTSPHSTSSQTENMWGDPSAREKAFKEFTEFSNMMGFQSQEQSQPKPGFASTFAAFIKKCVRR